MHIPSDLDAPQATDACRLRPVRRRAARWPRPTTHDAGKSKQADDDDGRRQLPESQVTQHSRPRPSPFRPAKQAAGRPITRAGRLACMQCRTTSQISPARQLTFSPRGRRQLREVASCPSVVVAPHGPICLRMDPCASYLAGRAGGLSQTGDGGDVRASEPASQRARYLPTAAGAPIC